MNLQPTLWRTCRILANGRRLACLNAVVSHPGESVGEIAARVRMPQDQASLCLRALQARGLLHACRDGRWVRYFPWPDPLVPTAAPLLAAMTRAVVEERRTAKHLVRCLTAFTHPRRLDLLRCLRQSVSLSFSGLLRKSGMSSPALVRHLRKLQARGLIGERQDGWALAPEREPLVDVLLRLLGPEQNVDVATEDGGAR